MVPAPIRYTFVWEDYVSLDKAVRQENVWKRYQLIIVPAFLMACVTIGLMLPAFVAGRPLWPVMSNALTSFYFWLAIPAFVLLVLGANHMERKLWYRRQRISGVEVEAVFDASDGIRLESKDGVSLLKWAGMRKIVSDEHAHTLLQENRMVGVCLPRRAFASNAEFTAAKAFIEQKIADARSNRS
jgi:hypothetical protein